MAFNMISGVNMELFDEMKVDIKQIFNLLDGKRTGRMCVDDLQYAFRGLGFNAKKEDIEKMIAELNEEDYNGEIDIDTFENLIFRMMLDKKLHEEVIRAFQILADKDIGKISFDSLKSAFKIIGETSSDEELRGMIEVADLDGDGFIDQDEFFIKILTIRDSFKARY